MNVGTDPDYDQGRFFRNEGNQTVAQSKSTSKSTSESSKSKVAQSKAAKTSIIEDIMAKKKAVTKKTVIQTDGEIATRIDELRQLHTAARDSDRISNESTKQAPRIQEQIDKITEESEATLVEFVFKSIGRHNYDELVELHPPSPDEKKEGADFNSDTFPPALVSASCVDPEIPIEAAEEMFTSPKWNGAELRKLFFAALDSNTETGEIPLSRSESEGTLNLLLNSITQQQKESPTLSM